MTKYNNNHYAQRAIIKNWSGLNKQKQFDGFVWHFDFVSLRLERAHARDVFARESLFSQIEEQRFNSLIEQPLARFRDAQIRRLRTPTMPRPGGVGVDERTLRALSLLWIVNVVRFNDAYAKDKGEEGPRLSKEFMERSDSQLDQIAEDFRSRFDLTSVVVEPLPMYYPEFGSFFLPLLDPEKKRAPGLSMVFPLDPRLALVAVPKSWRLDGQDPTMLHAFSVGIGQSRSIIVPDVLMKSTADHQEVTEIVVDLRKGAEVLFSEFRAVAGATGHDISGLPLGPTWPT